MAVFMEEFAVAASATSLDSSLGITDPAKFHYKRVLLRNNPAAAQDAFVGNSGVTTTDNRGLILRATDTMPSEISTGESHLVDIRKIFTIGTVGANNRIHVTLVS